MKKLFLLLVPFCAFAQSQPWDTIYGPMVTGCIQTSVTTSGANRSVQLTNGKRYLLYGVDSTAGMNGATLRCVQGNSSVDVTAIAGSRVGVIIFANQQTAIQVRSSNDAFVSCISQLATQKYELCALP